MVLVNGILFYNKFEITPAQVPRAVCAAHWNSLPFTGDIQYLQTLLAIRHRYRGRNRGVERGLVQYQVMAVTLVCVHD